MSSAPRIPKGTSAPTCPSPRVFVRHCRSSSAIRSVPTRGDSHAKENIGCHDGSRARCGDRHSDRCFRQRPSHQSGGKSELHQVGADAVRRPSAGCQRSTDGWPHYRRRRGGIHVRLHRCDSHSGLLGSELRRNHHADAGTHPSWRGWNNRAACRSGSKCRHFSPSARTDLGDGLLSDRPGAGHGDHDDPVQLLCRRAHQRFPCRSDPRPVGSRSTSRW